MLSSFSAGHAHPTNFVVDQITQSHCYRIHLHFRGFLFSHRVTQIMCTQKNTLYPMYLRRFPLTAQSPICDTSDYDYAPLLLLIAPCCILSTSPTDRFNHLRSRSHISDTPYFSQIHAKKIIYSILSYSNRIKAKQFSSAIFSILFEFQQTLFRGKIIGNPLLFSF